MQANKKLALGILTIILGGWILGVSSCGGEFNLGGLASGNGEGGSNLGGLAKEAANCPSLKNVRAIGKVDFAKEFELDAKAAAKLSSALKASVTLKKLSKEIEADLKLACGNLAKDLGAKPGTTAKSACQAAAKAIDQMKARAKGKLVVDIRPPRCTSSVDVMAKCAADCDVNVQPGQIDVQCEGGELSGKCDAMCSGKCEMQAGAKCEGSCRGSCNAQFTGKCAGKCDGKCDGQTTNGAMDCSGRCEGKCDGGANGSCGGVCKGGCKLKGEASCNGTCTGGCSVKMKKPSCTGDVKPPKMSADCKAECDARVSAKLNCEPALVSVKIVGAADAKAAGKLVAALKANLPAILKVSMGMKAKLKKASQSVKIVAKGVKSSLSGMAEGSASAAARLTTCVSGRLKSAIDAAASIQANVSVSVKVQASATGSASTQ